jgi:hypothetical protein
VSGHAAAGNRWPAVTSDPVGRNRVAISHRAATAVSSPGIPLSSSPAEARPAAPDASADSIIRQLFAISMTLASCAKTTDQHAASRVMEAIDGLDQVMSDLRGAVFDTSGAAGPTPVSGRHGQVGPTETNGGSGGLQGKSRAGLQSEPAG